MVEVDYLPLNYWINNWEISIVNWGENQSEINNMKRSRATFNDENSIGGKTKTGWIAN